MGTGLHDPLHGIKCSGAYQGIAFRARQALELERGIVEQLDSIIPKSERLVAALGAFHDTVLAPYLALAEALEADAADLQRQGR